MGTLAIEHAALLPLLPEERVGAVQRIDPINLGLSGAAVYAVTTSRGEYILRLQGDRIEADFYAQHLRILRRAAHAKVAPAIVHVDEAARAVVSERVGVDLPVALADPAGRGPVIASLIERLRTLHALDPGGVVERDVLSYIRGAWEVARQRPGFPVWAIALEPTLAPIAAALAQDPRRVVSHNDVNPGNVLWDGTQTWLIDWEVAGLGHPYYDLIALATFLRLDDAVALSVAAAHDGAPLDERSRAIFRALRPLVGLVAGLTLLGTVDDLHAWPVPTRADALSIGQCYDGFRSGELDLQTPRGRACFGLALLAEGFRDHSRPSGANVS